MSEEQKVAEGKFVTKHRPVQERHRKAAYQHALLVTKRKGAVGRRVGQSLLRRSIATEPQPTVIDSNRLCITQALP